MSMANQALDRISGIDYLRRVMTGELPLPAMATTIPMRFTHVAAGVVRITTIADERHLNTMDGVHGGFAATVIDTVTGCAIHSQMEASESYTTISLELKMLRPPPINETMYSEGRVINLSRRLGVAEGTLRNAEGKLVAQGSATCMIFRDTARD
jgi:uncharacterized protein (TIGR00369 family)